MSMFHELMMRKKEETLYPVIKGSLTESPEGVFSGFSESNYLKIDSGISVGQNFETYTKFTTGASLSGNQEILAGRKGSDIYLRIFIQNGATLFTSARVVGASGISHNQTSYSFQTNTTYSVKVKYDGTNKLDVFIYDNTGAEVKTNTFTLSAQIDTFNYFNIGTVGTSSSIWGGSIDLPNSYIKLGGTKYNLQAVVGYTIVGSPTITDGVASGFDNSNYLKIDNAIILSQADNWEIKIKIGTNTGAYILGANLQNIITCSIGTSSLYLSSNGSSWDIASGVGLSSRLPENSYLRLRFMGTHYIFDYSTDNVTWTTCADVTSSSKLSSSLSYLRIGCWGYGGSTTLFTGAIDLKETYIKVNNKLWFNGQQA